MPYDGLRFEFAEMEREIQSMITLSRPFIEIATAERVLPDFLQQLRTFRSCPADAQTEWVISTTNPIRTKADRQYEAGGRRSHHKVFGEITGIWTIKKQGRLDKHFVLLGKASFTAKILDCTSALQTTELARWNVDIGTFDSPGTHFHTQICLEPCLWFPKSLPVPRLPGLLHTPMDLLEFMLGELFQREWAKSCAMSSPALSQWNGCQKRRMTRLLEWQKKKINDSIGSPWTTLKLARPSLDLLG
jgi:hypothetical protein